MKVIISPRAEKQLKKLSKVNQIIITKRIRLLASSKSETRVEKLRGYKKIFRVRVGDFRIVYKKVKTYVYIVLISHRKDVYRLLKKLFR